MYCYTVDDYAYKLFRSGRLRLAVGKSRISSQVTWDEKTVSFTVLWLGDHNIYAGIREFMGDEEFSIMLDEMRSSFERADIQETIMLIDRHFGAHSYSLKDLFKDEQRKTLDAILQVSLSGAESRTKEILEVNYPLIRFLKSLGIPLPKALQAAADVAISSELRRHLAEQQIDLDLLEKLVEDSNTLPVELDGAAIALQGSSRVAAELEKVAETTDDAEGLEKLERIVRLLRRLPLELDFWRSQNLLFSIGQRRYPAMREKAQKNEEQATRWISAFDRLSEQLGIRIQA